MTQKCERLSLLWLECNHTESQQRRKGGIDEDGLQLAAWGKHWEAFTWAFSLYTRMSRKHVWHFVNGLLLFKNPNLSPLILKAPNGMQQRAGVCHFLTSSESSFRCWAHVVLQQWVSDMQLLMCIRGKQNLEKTQKSVTCNVLTWPRRPHEQLHMDTLMHASHTSLIDVFCHKRAVCDGKLAGEVGSVRCLLAFCPSEYSHLLSSTGSSRSLHLDLGGGFTIIRCAASLLQNKGAFWRKR